MKTLKNAYSKVYDFNNLYVAHKLARRGKRNKSKVINFEIDLNCNLIELQEELKNKTYKIGEYHKFLIFEPKERKIMSLPYKDRIVQHCICDCILEPFFEKILIYDNCASRRDKGTHFGLNRIKKFMKEFFNKWGTEGYILKGDISKYFYSIDHVILKDKLYKYIKDNDIIWLLDMIIDSTENPGLPIGNMTSQLFAIFYLNRLDRYCKEELKLKYYSRYMDDFVIIHEDKKYLQKCLKNIEKLVQNELKLKLNPKTQIFPIKNGIDYLGFHMYLTETGKVIKKIRRESKRRMERKLKKFQMMYSEDFSSFKSIKTSINSWIGHAKFGDTYNLRKKIFSKFVLKRGI